MDFDQLLYHHQMALIAVSRARRDGHPPSSFDLSDSYARRIAEYRDRRGLDDGPADKRRPGSARLKADPTTSEQAAGYADFLGDTRSEEHTSELQSLMRISYAVFCLKKKKTKYNNTTKTQIKQQS